MHQSPSKAIDNKPGNGDNHGEEQEDRRERCSVGLIPDQGDDHAVQVEEEEDQVEAQLGERFLQRLVSSGSSQGGLGNVSVPSCGRSASGRSRSHPGDACSR